MKTLKIITFSITLLFLSSCEIDDTNLTGKYYSESKDSFIEIKSDGSFIWYDRNDKEIILEKINDFEIDGLVQTLKEKGIIELK